jgi:acetyltransferase-like isoleucine patch superfamily enzyme
MMPYYNSKELESMGFKKLGKNVRISNKASIYDCEHIEIGDNSRIDDYCVVSGKIDIGRNVHVTPMCLLAGGEKGIVLEDFSTIAYGVKIFTQSDDYSGKTMTNSTIPVEFKDEFKREVVIRKHSIIGAGAIIMPGVTLEVGTSVGAMSLVRENTEPWGIYIGIPAKRIKDRCRDLLKMEERYLDSMN